MTVIRCIHFVGTCTWSQPHSNEKICHYVEFDPAKLVVLTALADSDKDDLGGSNPKKENKPVSFSLTIFYGIVPVFGWLTRTKKETFLY